MMARRGCQLRIAATSVAKGCRPALHGTIPVASVNVESIPLGFVVHENSNNQKYIQGSNRMQLLQPLLNWERLLTRRVRRAALLAQLDRAWDS